MQQTSWLERTWNFDFLAGMWAVYLQRMQGADAKLREYVKGLPKELLTWKPDGKWSIKEQIGHLIDLEELHTGRLEDFRQQKEILRAADMSNKKTAEAHHNDQDIEELLTDFQSGRKKFVEELHSVSDLEILRTSFHPRLQRQMRLVDMIYFVAEHDDHHITKILGIIGMRSAAN